MRLSPPVTVVMIALLLAGVPPLPAQRFLRDDPLWTDQDRLPTDLPHVRDLSAVVDFFQSTFVNRPEGEIAPAENVNTLGEVPDSSWFTNRIGRRSMTLDELARGPNQRTGPDASGPWTIVRAKSQGVSPGFTIQDARKDTYFIKFDPREYPQLATSTEVIATKFFYAFGYHVPENFLTLVRPQSLRIGDGAQITDALGKKRRMMAKDLDEILYKVARRPDGQIQAIASLALPGKPLGPFRYHGTRPDDANDIFPHENRRELRGLRVFAAWLNHDDARSINSLDVFLGEEGGAGHVLHHLIDFGSCLGSGSIKPQSRRAGYEYMLEWTPIIRAGSTMGVWDRAWRDIPYPDLPGVGRFEADFFQPREWKPEYPNPAFDRMRPNDAFWAARIVQRFTRPMIETIVRTGQLSHPSSERYLVKTLLERQRKIVQYYLAQLNPLDQFHLDGSMLRFQNPGLEAGLADSASYEYQWFAFDNRSEVIRPVGSNASSLETTLPIPRSSEEWLMVEIRTRARLAAWAKPVRVFLRNRPGSKVVGIEREE